MQKYPVRSIIECMPTFDVPVELIWPEFRMNGAMYVVSPFEYHTDRQRNWWKGVLLRGLEEETGESVSVWESRLKLAVLPDDFRPQYFSIHDKPFASLSSITSLSKKKMSQLIEGSVSQLHEWGFHWVTLPDPDLRKF